MKVLVALCAAFMLTKGICLAQLPVGAIAGTVCDPSGGVVLGGPRAFQIATRLTF